MVDSVSDLDPTYPIAFTVIDEETGNVLGYLGLNTFVEITRTIFKDQGF
jgi:hypothetical protein